MSKDNIRIDEDVLEVSEINQVLLNGRRIENLEDIEKVISMMIIAMVSIVK